MNRILFLITTIYIFFSLATTTAQGVPYPLNNEATYHIADRWDILYGSNNSIHTALKPYTRNDMMRYTRYVDSVSSLKTTLDKKDLQYLYNDNTDFFHQSELATSLGGKKEPIENPNAPPQYKVHKKPLFKYFYKTPANLFELDTRYFDLRINPILNFQISKERDNEDLLFLNQRGIDIRGSIDDRVYFYTNVLETQARFPNYALDWIQKNKAVPGAGLYKPYSSLIFDSNNGFDYLNAQGIVGFNFTPHIGMQLGHGRHFIGDGMRSLFLSDFANNYFFLKFDTKVWKFQYQNIFAELHAENRVSNDNLLPKKYIAAHYLTYAVSSKLGIGIFEATVMAREKQFELQYLNPIILYRSVEQALGSPDNVMIGTNLKWHFAKGFSFYGQMVFDEFLFSELFVNRRGSWTNKFGIQAGLKYINVLGIDHLDAQIEFNKVRPFTYSHYDSIVNYTHAFQPLAHPLGGNFFEVLFNLRYQALPNWLMEGRLMYAKIGENSLTENWGNNPLIPNLTRKMDAGYFTTEGVTAKTLLLRFDASYQFYHNMFVDVHLAARKKDSEDISRNQRTFYMGAGLRLNIGRTRLDF
jgi:hypothetical protein